MIDTDKYEGCSESAWRCVGQPYFELNEIQRWISENGPDTCNNSDVELWADAPLLLAEFKRLRGIIDYIREVGKMDRKPSEHLLSIMEKVLTTEEYLEWRDEE